MKSANFDEALAMVNRLSEKDKDKLILRLEKGFNDDSEGQKRIKKKNRLKK